MGALSRIRFASRRSPAREAVAECRNELVGLARAAGVAEAKVARAKSLRDQCQERLSAASDAARAARASHSEAMLRAAETGEAIATTSAGRDLRHAEADAAEDLSAAERAVEVLEAAAEAPAAAVREARDRLSKLVAAVIAEQAEDALAESDRALKALSRQRLVCLAIREFLPNDSTAARRMQSITYFDYPGIAEDRRAIEQQWSAAFDALAENPDAPLPSILVERESVDERGAA